jgi:hypothetical protein
MRRLAQFALGLLVLTFCTEARMGNAEIRGRNVASASIGKDGLIHILRSDGTEFVAPLEVSPVQLVGPDDKQVSVEPPIIADDGRTVGWLVNFPNCCTSYPIPLVLMIYRDGKVVNQIRSSVQRPIWKWVFIDGGLRVAYYSETVHGGWGRRCELRDVATGKMLDEWDRDEWDRSKGRELPGWCKLFAQDLDDLKEPAPK